MRRGAVLLVALVLALALASSACMRGAGARLLPAMVGTAIVTAAVVSASRPPPPRVVYVPPPQPGYVWQPGYWTLVNDKDWVWVDGGWVAVQPGYTWSPTHWEQAPDGSWQLVPGRWFPAVGP